MIRWTGSLRVYAHKKAHACIFYLWGSASILIQPLACACRDTLIGALRDPGAMWLHNRAPGAFAVEPQLDVVGQIGAGEQALDQELDAPASEFDAPVSPSAHTLWQRQSQRESYQGRGTASVASDVSSDSHTHASDAQRSAQVRCWRG